MSAFQFVNPAPLFFNIPGTAPIGTGGNLHFYDEGTTNPRDTWSDPDLDISHLNPNPVPLDASGRSTVAIWLDGDYTVVLRDSLGDLVWSRPVRSDVIAGLSIPTLVADYILSNDGSNLAWVDPIGALFPDPSGSAGYVLGTDGSNIFWTPQTEIPEPATPDIVITSSPKSVRIGVSDDTTKFLMKFGSDTVGPSGTKTVTKSIVFDAAFSATPWFIGISVTSGAATTSGAWPTWAVTSSSTTGFTVTFNIPDDDSRSQWQIGNTINFNWKAEGTLVVTP